jgi:transposase
MAKPYSQDLRERVIAAVEAGHTQTDVAAMLKIGRRTVVNYVKRWRTTGHVEPAKFGGHKKHKLADHANKVKALIDAEPDQTIAELHARLEAERIKVSASAVDRFLRASGLTYKKNSVRHRTKTQRRGRGSCRVARSAAGA